MCYHYSAQVISRADGRSAVSAAAYRATEKMIDTRTGEIHDFTKKELATFSEIMMPENAPTRFQNRAVLWNEVEATEKRKDSQLAREFNIALPNELSDSQQVDLMREFVRLAFVEKGMIADVNRHSNKGNYHFHVMTTMRSVSEEGFGQKNRDWNRKELLVEWRKLWADVANEHLLKAGHEARLDHRSLQDQGIEREPQIHHGNHAVRVERNNEIVERNSLVVDLRNSLTEVETELSQLLKAEQPIKVQKAISYQDAHELFKKAEGHLADVMREKPYKIGSTGHDVEALAQHYKKQEVSDLHKEAMDLKQAVEQARQAYIEFEADKSVYDRLREFLGLQPTESRLQREESLRSDFERVKSDFEAKRAELAQAQSPEAHSERLERAERYVQREAEAHQAYSQWQRMKSDAEREVVGARQVWEQALERDLPKNQQPAHRMDFGR